MSSHYDRLSTVELAQRIAYDYHKEHWAARRGPGPFMAPMPHFNDCDFEGCEDSRELIRRLKESAQ